MSTIHPPLPSSRLSHGRVAAMAERLHFDVFAITIMYVGFIGICSLAPVI